MREESLIHRAAGNRVVVVGAGLVGLAASCELARLGHRVVLLERSIAGATATTASSAAAGILGPQLEHDDDGPTLALGLEGARATGRLLERLEPLGRLEVDHHTSAAVKVAFDDDGARALGKRVAWQSARGLRVELVDGADARARVPCLSSEVLAAAFFPDDHCLDPRAYARALRSLALAQGVELREGAMAGLVVERDRCAGVRLESGEALLGDAVLLCAGAWSAVAPGVRALLGLTLDDVHPVKGQIVELAAAPGLIDRVIYGACYLVPRSDGRVVCGSTMERVGFDTSVSDDDVARIRERAAKTVPALANAAVRSTWAGLRPATRDGLPLLGESALPGLWLSTGHFRNGVLLAAVSAEIIGALLSGAPVDLDLRPFRPERLGCSR